MCDIQCVYYSCVCCCRPVESEAAVQHWLQDADPPGERWPCCSLQDDRKPVQETGRSDRGLCQGESHCVQLVLMVSHVKVWTQWLTCGLCVDQMLLNEKAAALQEEVDDLLMAPSDLPQLTWVSCDWQVLFSVNCCTCLLYNVLFVWNIIFLK